MTVGELKKWLDENEVPDDAIVEARDNEGEFTGVELDFGELLGKRYLLVEWV